jgi:hypothetical protein
MTSSTLNTSLSALVENLQLSGLFEKRKKFLLPSTFMFPGNVFRAASKE